MWSSIRASVNSDSAFTSIHFGSLAWNANIRQLALKKRSRRLLNGKCWLFFPPKCFVTAACGLWIWYPRPTSPALKKKQEKKSAAATHHVVSTEAAALAKHYSPFSTCRLCKKCPSIDVNTEACYISAVPVTGCLLTRGSYVYCLGFLTLISDICSRSANTAED